MYCISGLVTVALSVIPPQLTCLICFGAWSSKHFDRCCLNYLTPKIILSLQKLLDFRYLYIRWANVKIKLCSWLFSYSKYLVAEGWQLAFHCCVDWFQTSYDILRWCVDILRWCVVSCMLVPIWLFCKPSRVLLCVVCFVSAEPVRCETTHLWLSLELNAGKSS